MTSLIPGYEYGILISYRQKENKVNRCSNEFAEALKTEFESTFKEEIDIFFDINPQIVFLIFMMLKYQARLSGGLRYRKVF